MSALTIAKVLTSPTRCQSFRRERPTDWMVRIEGSLRMRRVYVFAVGNAGTAIIRWKGRLYKHDSSCAPCVGGTFSPWNK